MWGSKREEAGSARRRVAAAVMLGLGLGPGLVVGCAGRVHSSAPIRTSGAGLTGDAYGGEAAALPDAPGWAKQAHSWGKLDAIEAWLREATDQSDFWRAEAKLQLAEGQMRFAQQDAGRGSHSGPARSVVAYRMSSALGGFEDVLETEGATEAQLRRARSGARTARAGGAKLEEQPVAALPAGMKVGGLVTRATWRAARPDRANMNRSTGRWNWITIHHSVFDSPDDPLDTVRRIQRVHMKNEGYADIGYHFLIDRRGRVIEGRGLEWQGAHAGGRNNRGNVGICLLGNFDEERPTRAAIRSLDRLVHELQSKLRIPRKNVRPHKAWRETECPGEHMMPWFARR